MEVLPQTVITTAEEAKKAVEDAELAQIRIRVREDSLEDARDRFQAVSNNADAIEMCLLEAISNLDEDPNDSFELALEKAQKFERIEYALDRQIQIWETTLNRCGHEAAEGQRIIEGRPLELSDEAKKKIDAQIRARSALT